MSKMSLCALTLGACAGGAAAQNAFLAEWNLIVRNDFTTTSEVDGSALIGGNVTGSGVFASMGVTSPDGYALAVGGSFSGNYSMNNGGGLLANGALSATVNMNGGGDVRTDFMPTGNINLNGGSLINPAGVDVVSDLITPIFSQAQSLSAQLASLTPTGVFAAGVFSGAPMDFGGVEMTVYSVANSEIQSWSDLNISLGASETVVINVFADNAQGLVDFIASPNLIGGFSQSNSGRILWNLVDAEILEVGNSFNGAILAPGADLRLRSGGINGTVVVDSVSVMNAEIRRHTFDAPLVPAPGAGLVLVVAGAMGSLRRRAR